nr:hypothetical protein [Pandoravirus aubagnensis]
MSAPVAQQASTNSAGQKKVDVADLVTMLQEAVAALTASSATPTSAPAVTPEPATTETPATKREVVGAFKAHGRYTTQPRPLMRADRAAGDYHDAGYGHMTVAQFAERVGALPVDALVATGSYLAAKMLRVHSNRHRFELAIKAPYTDDDSHDEPIVSPAHAFERDGVTTVLFNAVALGGGPIDAARLARKLAKYAEDAPDALVLVGDSLAWMSDDQKLASAPGAYVPVLASCHLSHLDKTPLCPYGPTGIGHASVNRVVDIAKSMFDTMTERNDLGRVATYVASAMADGGLAAFDLYFVPRAHSRAVAAAGFRPAYGELLTLAEFQAAHGGRTITEGQISRFYRPVMPSDASVVYNGMARILAANVDNVTDLYALLDDPRRE